MATRSTPSLLNHRPYRVTMFEYTAFLHGDRTGDDAWHRVQIDIFLVLVGSTCCPFVLDSTSPVQDRYKSSTHELYGFSLASALQPLSLHFRHLSFGTGSLCSRSWSSSFIFIDSRTIALQFIALISIGHHVHPEVSRCLHCIGLLSRGTHSCPWCHYCHRWC